MKQLLPYLIATGGSITASLLLQSAGKQKASNFIGLWAPTILSLAVLHKVTQLEQRSMTGGASQQRRAA
ncbi:MAG TPA: hypothetical protein VFC63_09545 [Blastocatellia bacterium]|nr:hypothetical protein [Blastocatellia bacterium]